MKLRIKRRRFGQLMIASSVVAAIANFPRRTFAQIINQLIAAYHFTGKSIVASEYAGTLGVPAFFSRAFFPELMTLGATEGAKHLIRRHSDQVFSVPFPEGAIDIDTPTDYQQFQTMTGI